MQLKWGWLVWQVDRSDFWPNGNVRDCGRPLVDGPHEIRTVLGAAGGKGLGHIIKANR